MKEELVSYRDARPFAKRPVRLQRKDVRRFALEGHGVKLLGVLDRADEVLVPAHEVRGHDAKDDGRKPAADEALPSLLGRQLYQRRLAEEEAEHVGHDVVADDHRHRDDEPLKKRRQKLPQLRFSDNG